MSVDTYLRGKNTSRYRRIAQGDLELLVSPLLIQQADAVFVDTRRSFFRRVFRVEAHPRGEHFHGPACAH